ncbi:MULTISPECIES: class IIb bacteriocin, lactobin A/cerein 7B family [unclassified Microcoleus]|uniref:class IIb bacteriocin, lactobin A/cerein 7B family n=1 Tax=unclassified Microcoleus TaxID=2642155 RepID=UPI002FD67901
MSFEFESVNPSFQEVSQAPELQHQSQSDTSELSDDELEQVNGGILPLLALGVRLAAPVIGRTVANLGRSAGGRAVGEAVRDFTGNNDDC